MDWRPAASGARGELVIATVMAVTGPPAGKTTALVYNGSTGGRRRSSAELGKRLFEMKSDYAVRQIKQRLNTPASAAQ